MVQTFEDAPRDLEAEIRALECQNELLRLALAKAHEELEGRNVRTFSTVGFRFYDDGAVVFGLGPNVATVAPTCVAAHA